MENGRNVCVCVCVYGAGSPYQDPKHARYALFHWMPNLKPQLAMFICFSTMVVLRLWDTYEQVIFKIGFGLGDK